MIKAVVFDLGNVLVNFDYTIAARQIAPRTRFTADELMAFLARSPFMLEYEKGLLSRQEFFAVVRSGTGFVGDLAKFASLFGDIFSEITPMVQLQAALRRRGLPSYVFSNTNDMAVEHLRRDFPFFGNFDGYVLSYEHHAMKPDPALYESLERLAGRRGEELFYLDDRPENVDAGAARGWQALLHESPEKSLAAVRKLGLLA
jgi:FMN phosphatase YigB (HAD superfamily)